jgi:ATP-dependent Clp protease ATP-binding subunit ClpC
VFERFTDRARRVVVYAQEEARMLNHNYIGTEHILLGLIHEGEGVAARALKTMSISLDSARQRVEEIIGQGPAVPVGHIPFTPRAKKVLEDALREALQLGHNYIGTEHILLGLLREGEGVGAQVLQELGASLEQVRTTVIQLLAGYTASAEEAAGAGSVGPMTEVYAEVVPEDDPAKDPRCARCHALLADTLTVSTLERTVGEEQLELKVAHCGRCGSALGVLP